MRIVVDGTSLLLRSAGVKTHMYYWIRALVEHAGAGSIRVFPFLGGAQRLVHGESVCPRWSTAARLSLVHFSNVWNNPVLELLEAGADVFHASQHLQNPPHRRTKLTATIFDMTCWLMPHLHVAANVTATRRYAERVLRRADACIAISEQTRRDAIEILRIPEDRMEVIYPGVADRFFSVSRDEAAAAAKKYGLVKPYVLYVGTIEPRKNVDGMLDAFATLPRAIRQDIDLVIAGPLGWCTEATRARLTGSPGEARYLGYVAEPDLPGLTAGATVFLFPSFYEGFGIPVGQGMACGVPVVTSRGSSLEEIAGPGGALLVDPHSVDEIADALQRVITSPSLRRELGDRGRSRAGSFRWSHSARQSLAFFERVARS